MVPVLLSSPMKYRSCHLCGASFFRRDRTVKERRTCKTCGRSWHVMDCGNRRARLGAKPHSVDCPVCTTLCACSGGPVVCHPHQRSSRKRNIRKTVIPNFLLQPSGLAFIAHSIDITDRTGVNNFVERTVSGGWSQVQHSLSITSSKSTSY